MELRDKLEVPASVDCNIFEMTDEERKAGRNRDTARKSL